MSNILKEYLFRPVDNVWRNVNGDGEVLADVLRQYDVIMDDRCQFTRLYDYDAGWCLIYRAYGAMKITMTFYSLN